MTVPTHLIHTHWVLAYSPLFCVIFAHQGISPYKHGCVFFHFNQTPVVDFCAALPQDNCNVSNEAVESVDNASNLYCYNLPFPSEPTRSPPPHQASSSISFQSSDNETILILIQTTSTLDNSKMTAQPAHIVHGPLGPSTGENHETTSASPHCPWPPWALNW